MRWPAFAGELQEAPDPAYRRDFGGLTIAMPLAVLRPAHAEDVQRAVRFARAENLPVVARGQAHTTRGQSLTRGLVLDLGALDRVLDLDGESVRVQAGARWSRVVDATLARGLSPPVLTDHLDLSVGGTLSVGGVGGQSFRHGLQLDNVLELTVVTGRGELVRCSAHHHPALFDGCRGSLGQLGVIVEARLRLVPAPRTVRCLKLEYRALDAFLRAQHRLADDGRFDYLCGNFTPDRRFDLDCVQPLGEGAPDALDGLDCSSVLADRELPFGEFVHRLQAMVAAMKQSGTWSGLHPWMDLFLPASRAASVIDAALAALDRDELGDGYVMTYPLVRARCRSSFPALPDEDRLFLFDILPSLSAPLYPAFEMKCERLLLRAREAGATVYPIGFPLGTHLMQPVDWRRQLGARHDELARLAHEVDPDAVLGSAVAMF